MQRREDDITPGNAALRDFDRACVAGWVAFKGWAFRVDVWDARGDNIIEHVAGIDDFEVAEAAYRAAVARWPAARIMLR